MQERSSFLVLIILAAIILAVMSLRPSSTYSTGCAKDARICSDESIVSRAPPGCEFLTCPAANSYQRFADNLREQGLTVVKERSVDYSFIQPHGSILNVSGDEVLAFEFDDEQSAASFASSVSVDGRKVSTYVMPWSGPAYFYKSGRLIAIEVNASNKVKEALAKAMGQPFAGGGTATKIANPASSYCIERGGTLKIFRTDGGEYGVCTLPSGVTCEEWAYFRGDCP